MLGNAGVCPITSCELKAVSGVWQYATDNAAAIDSHWQQAQASNPRMFNGIVYLMCSARLEHGRLSADLVRTDFKSFMFWRGRGHPESGVRDGFGSALIRSHEGHILLGRQRHGNVNGGQSYLPGGFIDVEDVAPDGTIDIDSSIDRELREETGLTTGEHLDRHGYLLTVSGAQISIAREYRSKLTSVVLRQQMLRHLATDSNSELTDIVIVRGAADLAALPMPEYAQILLPWLVADEGRP